MYVLSAGLGATASTNSPTTASATVVRTGTQSESLCHCQRGRGDPRMSTLTPSQLWCCGLGAADESLSLAQGQAQTTQPEAGRQWQPEWHWQFESDNLKLQVHL